MRRGRGPWSAPRDPLDRRRAQRTDGVRPDAVCDGGRPHGTCHRGLGSGADGGGLQRCVPACPPAAFHRLPMGRTDGRALPLLTPGPPHSDPRHRPRGPGDYQQMRRGFVPLPPGRGGEAGRCLSRAGRESRGGGWSRGGGGLPRHPPAGLNHIYQELQKCTTWTHSVYTFVIMSEHRYSNYLFGSIHCALT